MNISISAAVITYNEEDRIADCLKSLSFADEIVLVDAQSRDRTIAVAEKFGCRIIRNPWPGFSVQKQLAVNECRNDWIMILDADERVPEETSNMFENLISSEGNQYAAFGFRRKNFFHGKWIKHCGWWPDTVVRLVNRKKGRYSDSPVHERWISDGPVKMRDAVIHHHSFRNYAGLIEKMQHYSTLAAEKMFREGRSAGWWTPLGHGFWTFITTYFFHLGFIHGFDGFMISLMNAQGSFMKYAKLIENIRYTGK